MRVISRPKPLILIIDDNRDIGSLLDLLLSEEGYEVMYVESLARGGAVLATRAPDLVIADVRLSGAHPFAVMDLLMADPATRDIPLLLCTAAVWDVEEGRARVERAGVDVVFKPFDIDELLAAVQHRCPRPAMR
jgi:CheY-like chemotaxis protein